MDALDADLSLMFDRLRSFSFAVREPTVQVPTLSDNETVELGRLCSELKGHLKEMKSSGLLGDPWGAASLRTDEVRNTSVLSWFLDPEGGHGCGGALLTYILSRLENMPGCFPPHPSKQCRVSVEISPDGDQSSRVDIQIADPGFFILVEVKIYANEQAEQIERYCNIAKMCASGRPWAVIFLTTDGREPFTAGKHDERVLSVEWRQIAMSLRRAAKSAPPIPRFLATSFATHIQRF